MFLILAPLCCSCSSKEDKLAKRNLKAEYIYRNSDEYFFNTPLPQRQVRAPYPWEEKLTGGFPKITKEYFRCKGNSLNPIITQEREGREPIYYRDCHGGEKHGLPLVDNKEFVYPCLIDILNYLQTSTKKQVVITCGHRCPVHNAYSDHTSYNWGSKHMLGGEVDFYIEGLEPETLIELIQAYYQQNYPDEPDYTNFVRFESQNMNVSTPPWYNKEIFIKLYQEDEGRDFDNLHSHPYLSIQVRYSKELDKKVVFEKAQSENYLRH
ncbi:MAG: hypothetical protein S4CHLAM123_04340 [Chlamydiales bacterium]|nr:hypothetical protein [Chlamydiales bacterium]